LVLAEVDQRLTEDRWPKGVAVLRNVQIGATRVRELRISYRFDGLMGEALVAVAGDYTPVDMSQPALPPLTINLNVRAPSGTGIYSCRPMIGKGAYDVPGSPNWSGYLKDPFEGRWLSADEAKAIHKHASSVGIRSIDAN